ncbi:DMT family transporter [Candidatus Allofournierella merdipullorum]|uniref:DMT family transporter n=1 Tax=Candidatus Allofournierella merdipullorum TaxID=2838595 RepID=UPI003AB8F281
MKQELKYLPVLALTALIWGVAFVAQSVGGEHVGPFTFNCVRSLLGGAVLLPMIPLLGRLSGNRREEAAPADRKNLWLGGALCGIILGLASSLQQWALEYASVGKAGFITALYIVIVPVLGIFFHRMPGAQVWLAVVVAVAGLYLLCWSGGAALGPGEWMLFGCSALFSLHILVIDHFSPLVDGVKLSCIQFFVAGLFCAVPTLLFEKPAVSDVLAAWAPILYAGALSCGVAYTLQVVAQKHVEPTLASLTLSLESVFSVLAGWLLLHQTLTARELAGCALVFCAIVLAQLPSRKKVKH